MIRQLARCPYCPACDIALDDRPELVFRAASPPGDPCEHLVWVEGRYSEWEPGAHGVNRVIGSTEFRWDHPRFGAGDGRNPLADYLAELVNTGPAWEYAPPGPFAPVPLSAEEKTADARGREQLLWEVDGTALFAADAGAFLTSLPAYRQRWLAGLRVRPEGESA